VAPSGLDGRRGRPGQSGGFPGADREVIQECQCPTCASAGRASFSVGTAGSEPTTP
jgi:hypothetical protein